MTSHAFDRTAKTSHFGYASHVQQIKTELQKLSPAELQEIRDWLDDVLENHLVFTDEFESQIKQSEQEMKDGASSRS